MEIQSLGSSWQVGWCIDHKFDFLIKLQGSFKRKNMRILGPVLSFDQSHTGCLNANPDVLNTY